MLERLPLFPEVEPRETGKLAVDNRHTLHYERVGNPKGVPALFLHAYDAAEIRGDAVARKRIEVEQRLRGIRSRSVEDPHHLRR